MTKLEQSFQNFKNATASLERAVADKPTEERDFAGIIQSFEFTYELCWKTLKIILEQNGIEAPFPRTVFEAAFKLKMIEGNEIWKDIIEARNLTSQTYDPKLAQKMYPEIKDKYLPIFKATAIKMAKFVVAT